MKGRYSHFMFAYDQNGTKANKSLKKGSNACYKKNFEKQSKNSLFSVYLRTECMPILIQRQQPYCGSLLELSDHSPPPKQATGTWHFLAQHYENDINLILVALENTTP